MYLLQFAVLAGLTYLGYRWLRWVPLPPTTQVPLRKKTETMEEVLARLKQKHGVSEAKTPNVQKINQGIDQLFRRLDDLPRVLTPE